VGCYQPSTASRRLSVVVVFYRVCVIDRVWPHSPAGYVRRPPVPRNRRPSGLAARNFEALITTAQLSDSPNDFAFITMLGLPGLRIFEACGPSISDLSEEHGHRVLRVRSKVARTSSSRSRRPWAGRWIWPSTVAVTHRPISLAK
jgi:integrase/recombinase XerD